MYYEIKNTCITTKRPLITKILRLSNKLLFYFHYGTNYFKKGEKHTPRVVSVCGVYSLKMVSFIFHILTSLVQLSICDCEL